VTHLLYRVRTGQAVCLLVLYTTVQRFAISSMKHTHALISKDAN